MLAFFTQLPSCVVATEACGGALFWGREIARPGCEVRLIPPDYVKPFVKCQKNNSAGAEAICKAAQRPTMRFVPVKSKRTKGQLTILVDPAMIRDVAPTGRRGQPDCSDAAFQICLTMKVPFGTALRQTTVLVESLLRLIDLDWAVPNRRTRNHR